MSWETAMSPIEVVVCKLEQIVSRSWCPMGNGTPLNRRAPFGTSSLGVGSCIQL